MQPRNRSKATRRRVMVIPASNRAQINHELERYGFGPDTFSQPLFGRTATATAKATHYSCDIACTPKQLKQMQRVLKTVIGSRILAGDGVKQDNADRLKAIESAMSLKRKQSNATVDRVKVAAATPRFR